MDKATSGKILVDGKDVAKYGEKELTQYRRDDIGFVFQFYNLVQNLTALENVELATQISKNPLDVKMVLNRVGLEKRMNNFPAQLSGGEQQRVAIARAIAKNPKLLLLQNPRFSYKMGVKLAERGPQHALLRLLPRSELPEPQSVQRPVPPSTGCLYPQMA